MPKLSEKPPKLGRDGRYACVYTGGKKIRLGKWDTDEARQAYRRFLAEWAALGQAVNVRAGQNCLIEELALAFLTDAKPRVGRSDFGNYKTAIECVLEIYPETSVAKFGPKSLAVIQQRFVQRGYARGFCNKLTNFVRTIFRWGVANEMVTAAIADALKYVQPLRQGKTAAHENEPRQDVPDSVVEATLPLLLPTIAGMVQVQRLACMRPNEVCRMKVGDIDTSGEIWLYRPGKHKGTWRGHDKVVPLGRPEQEIIGPRLIGKRPEQHVFSPHDTLEEKKVRDSARRKTKVQPSQAKRKEQRTARPKRNVRDGYDSESYAQNLKRTLDRHNATAVEDQRIPLWTPYQLRHAAVTEIAATEGLDTARAVAGQKTINVTQRYNHSDVQVAIRHAEKRSRQADRVESAE